MTTEAQIEANRKNATASTGPATPEGKSKSSRNAVSHGLFSAGNLIHPDENSEFSQLAEALRHDLAPAGAIEEILAAEITRGAGRLRRCASVEDGLTEQTSQTGPESFLESVLDPMANPATSATQNAVDRARAETHRILKRSMDELRRLQNERRFRFEILHEGVDTGDLGLASYKDLMPAMAAEKRWQRLKREEEGLGSFQSMLELAVAGPTHGPTVVSGTAQTNSTKQTQSAPAPDSTKRTQPAPNAPRNAPCPCGSGEKHKRCCGKNAPPGLYSAAA